MIMATNRIDAINERRAQRKSAPPAALPYTPVGGSPVVQNGIANNTDINTAPVPVINPESITQESYRRVALQGMDENAFEQRGKEQLNASDKEYWNEQARMNPLNTYANLRNYFASEETPEEQRRRERSERLGQVFANLGNLIGNAANLYYTSQGAVPVELNSGAIAANERMQRIKDKRDALQARQDALLAQAKGDDIRNAYNLRQAREKAAVDAAEKQKGRDLDMAKFGMKLRADRDKDDADRALNARRAEEQARHNRAMEANARSAQDKVLDSGIGSDGYVYTRNSKLSDTEAIQFVRKYMTDDDLKRFERREIEPVYNSETKKIENVEKRYVDWDAAAGEILQSGKVPPDELASRGFIRSGREGVRPMTEMQGWGYERQGLRGQAFGSPWSLSAPGGGTSSSSSKTGWSLNN